MNADSTMEYFVIADNDTCSAIAYHKITVNTCTGINKIEAAAFKVFPNPAQNILYISSLKSGDLTIYDVSSRIVKALPLKPV